MRYKIIYYSIIAWDRIRQRPQFLAEELSKLKNTIFYVNPHYTFIDYAASKLKLTPKIVPFRLQFSSYKISNNLIVISPPLMLPDFNINIIMRLNSKINSIFVKKIIKNNKIDYVWISEPKQRFIINHFKLPIIYDIMDDYPNFHKNKRIKDKISKFHNSVINNATIILGSSKLLLPKINKCKKLLIPNAHSFSGIKKDKPILNTSKKTIGYVGYLGDWFDSDIIERFSRNHPSFEIALVGPNHLKQNNNLKKMKNVTLYGTVKHEDIGKYISSFDVCLYPFISCPLIEKVDPVKIYEYLAFNKPVVALRTFETKKFEKLCYLYEGYDEFEEKILNAIYKHKNHKKKLVSFLEKNTWKKRSLTIIQNLE